MGRLLLKTGLFLTGLGLILLPFCVLSLRADKEALASVAFKMGPETSLVVAGDSHTETAINPALLPGSINISRSAENYFYTFHKLKYILNMNPQVTTVVLGYSPHNVMNHDRNFYEDRSNQLKDYISIIDSSGRRELASLRLSYVVAYLQAEYGIPFRFFQNPILVKFLLGRRVFARVDFPFSGNYKELRGTFVDPEKVAKRGNEHFWLDDRYVGTSPLMVDYLKKIAALCRERRIAIILLDTPVTESYRAVIPAEATAESRKILANVMPEFPNMSYCDLSSMELQSDNFFDGNHVNSAGAKVVSTLFRNRYGDLFSNVRSGNE